MSYGQPNIYRYPRRYTLARWRREWAQRRLDQWKRDELKRGIEEFRMKIARFESNAIKDIP